MKKIGIITISDYTNYGNRLQNYAVQEKLRQINMQPETIQNIGGLYNANFIKVLKNKLANNFKKIINKPEYQRYSKFLQFNKYIIQSKILIDKNHISKKLGNKYDYFVVGSDQVWNPMFGRLSDIDLLNFTNPSKKISFSASFGIHDLPESYKEKTRKALSTFKAISVREDAGKEIIEDLTARKDVQVLVDPTMLLSAEEWDKVSKKPQQLNNMKSKKYILNYFLGELSEEWKNEINRIAKENNCEVINILDKNSPFYQTGPSEFLYLEKNAFLVCTDSFHSSVFSIIYDTPFIIFERKDKNVSMNSRLETLLSKFSLQQKRFNGLITEDLLKCDYTQAKKILEKEKEKSINFLKKALDIEEGVNNE